MEKEALVYYAVKYRGNYEKIAAAIVKNEAYPLSFARYQALTLLDPQYPACLKELRYPPFVLFYCGDLSLLEKRKTGIIGSRMMSSYGRQATEWIVDHLQKEVVVSGLAKGIDGCAHQRAISKGKKTIGVLGCGLNVAYPKENAALIEEMKQRHLVLSEYPPDTMPLKFHFPWRNRIIAALSDRLIVTQAAVKSGTMITVDAALELDRDIWTIPYPLFDPQGTGCNQLIENGAKMILDSEDLK